MSNRANTLAAYHDLLDRIDGLAALALLGLPTTDERVVRAVPREVAVADLRTVEREIDEAKLLAKRLFKEAIE